MESVNRKSEFSELVKVWRCERKRMRTGLYSVFSQFRLRYFWFP